MLCKPLPQFPKVYNFLQVFATDSKAHSFDWLTLCALKYAAVAGIRSDILELDGPGWTAKNIVY